MGERWSGFLVRLGIGLGLAILAVVALRPLGMIIAPAPAVLVGTSAAVVTWLLGIPLRSHDGPRWERPEPPSTVSTFQADRRTRRTASMLLNAQPGLGFDTRGVARRLAAITDDRLARNHRLDIDDPGVEKVLSPKLLRYLRAAEDEEPPTLNRRTLHAHLKEIDQL